MSKRRSAEEWNTILEAYSTRSGSKEQFCNEHGVKSAALSYQLERRSGKRKFTAVSNVEKSSAEAVLLEFPSGLRLRISS